MTFEYKKSKKWYAKAWRAIWLIPIAVALMLFMVLSCISIGPMNVLAILERLIDPMEKIANG